MNKKLKALIIILVLPISIVMPMLLAQTASIDSKVYAQQSDSLLKNIEKYKAKLQTSPAKSDLDMIAKQCDNSKQKTEQLKSKTASIVTKRTEAYTKINDRLEKLSNALKTKEVDVASLNQAISALKEQTTAFETGISEYQKVIADLNEINCKEDPLAFRAALVEAKVSQAKLLTDSTAIKEQVNSAIKPALKQAREDLIIKEQPEDATTNIGTDQSQQIESGEVAQ